MAFELTAGAPCGTSSTVLFAKYKLVETGKRDLVMEEKTINANATPDNAQKNNEKWIIWFYLSSIVVNFSLFSSKVKSPKFCNYATLLWVFLTNAVLRWENADLWIASKCPENLIEFPICLISHNRAGVLPYVIERAKKCLDFSATLYIIHIFICIVYGGWPSSTTWWIVNITGFAVMALFGEYLCIKRELREIPIARYRSSKLLFPPCVFADYRINIVWGKSFLFCYVIGLFYLVGICILIFHLMFSAIQMFFLGTCDYCSFFTMIWIGILSILVCSYPLLLVVYISLLFLEH